MAEVVDEREHVGGRPLGEPRPPVAGDARHGVGPARAAPRPPSSPGRTRSTGSRATAARACPSAPQKVADRSARWSSSWRWSSSDSGVSPSGTRCSLTSRRSSAPPQPLRPRPAAAPTTAWSMVGGTASSRPEVHTSTGRQPRSPKPRIVQSSSGCRCLSTKRSPSMTTRSRVEPDLPSVPPSGAPLGGAGDELVDRRGCLAGHEPGRHVSQHAPPAPSERGPPVPSGRRRTRCRPRSGRPRTLRRWTWWAACACAADLEGVEVAHDLAALDREPLDGLEHARARRTSCCTRRRSGTGPWAWKRQPGTVASRRASSAYRSGLDPAGPHGLEEPVDDGGGLGGRHAPHDRGAGLAVRLQSACRPVAGRGCDGRRAGTGAGPIRGATTMSTTTTPVDNGVDVEFLLGAREALTAEPEGAKFTVAGHQHLGARHPQPDHRAGLLRPRRGAGPARDVPVRRRPPRALLRREQRRHARRDPARRAGELPHRRRRGRGAEP